MAAYDDDCFRALHCVGWNSADSMENAAWKYFDDYEECINYAQHQKDRSIRYIWVAEKGSYYNKGHSKVSDWMYYWWCGRDGIDAGELPEIGYGVPESKSWNYVVKYESHDPKRRRK